MAYSCIILLHLGTYHTNMQLDLSMTNKAHNFSTYCMNRLIELRFYIPPDTKWVTSETFFPANQGQIWHRQRLLWIGITILLSFDTGFTFLIVLGASLVFFHSYFVASPDPFRLASGSVGGSVEPSVEWHRSVLPWGARRWHCYLLLVCTTATAYCTSLKRIDFNVFCTAAVHRRWCTWVFNYLEVRALLRRRRRRRDRNRKDLMCGSLKKNKNRQITF